MHPLPQTRMMSGFAAFSFTPKYTKGTRNGVKNFAALQPLQPACSDKGAKKAKIIKVAAAQRQRPIRED